MMNFPILTTAFDDRVRELLFLSGNDIPNEVAIALGATPWVIALSPLLQGVK